MSLFGNYANSGKGVAKGGPQKKPFFRFWELFARKFWKFFQLNVIYLIFCLPVVTFGPATAALTHVMRKFYLEQPVFVFSEFFDAFKKNFKQSVALGIVDVGFIALFVYAMIFWNTQIDAAHKTEDMIMMALTVAAGTIFLIAHFYIYMEIVALKLRMGAMVKNALILVVVGLKSNLIMLLVYLGIGSVFFLLFPYSFAVLPVIPFAWLAFTTMFVCYPVIQRTIINPYYESRGEVNPELAEIAPDEEAVFVDRGGQEAPVKVKSVKTKTSGKVIR